MAGKTRKSDYVLHISKFLLIPEYGGNGWKDKEVRLCNPHLKICTPFLPCPRSTFIHLSCPRQNVTSSKKPFLTSPADLVSAHVAFLYPLKRAFCLKPYWLRANPSCKALGNLLHLCSSVFLVFIMRIIVAPTALGWLWTLNERRKTQCLAQGWAHTENSLMLSIIYNAGRWQDIEYTRRIFQALSSQDLLPVFQTPPET